MSTHINTSMGTERMVPGDLGIPLPPSEV